MTVWKIPTTPTVWQLPTAPDVAPRSYGEMTSEQLTDAGYAVDATYADLCKTRDAYLRRVREGRTFENPLFRQTLDSLCEMANKEIQRVLAAMNERERWAKLGE